MTNNCPNIFTFWDLLLKNALSTPQKVALREKKQDITYLELKDRAEKIALWLKECGIRRGDRVAIQLPKSTYEVAAIFAVARIGAIFVNLNVGLAPDQVAHVVKDCHVKALITDAPRIKRLSCKSVFELVEYTLQADTRPPIEGATYWPDLPSTGYAEPCPAIDTDVAALIYTSGSSGMPKGVMLTHANIVCGARSVSSYLNNTPSDKVLSVMPFSFDYGLNQLTTMMLVGGTLILQSTSLVTEIIDNLQAEGATGLGLVPTLWFDFVSALQEAGISFSNLRYVTNTGGHIPESVLLSMEKLLPKTDIVLMYGLTESFRSTWLPPEMLPHKRGAIGIPIPNSEIFVVDENEGLCSANEAGELLHRGALVSKGYWNKPELTAEKIKPNKHLKSLIGDEVVVHSGDLVKRDHDGILWFIGRIDGLIKTSGYRVSPTEVEQALLSSDMLKEAFAFGVPDDRLGQSIVAVVRPEKISTFKLEALKRWCYSNMSTYLIPTNFYVHEEAFPRNANEKIDGKRLVSYINEN